MSADRLTAESRAILESHLSTYERLEILLGIRTGATTVAEVTSACRLDEQTTRKALAELAQSRLIDYDAGASTVQLAPLARETACEAVMALYETDRAAILSVLSTLSVRRVRAMAARVFADAFVFRKKGDGDG